MINCNFPFQGTIAEWRIVLYIWAGVYTSGAVFFVTFAEGETQAWALDDPDGRSKKGKSESEETYN